MPTPEFIFLNDQAVKVTSLRPDDAGGFTLVLIARGGADRDRTLELLNDAHLQVRLDQGTPRHMKASDVDIRSTGDGPQAIHRIEAALSPASREATPPPDPIIDRLDRIVALLTEIRDQVAGDTNR